MSRLATNFILFISLLILLCTSRPMCAQSRNVGWIEVPADSISIGAEIWIDDFIYGHVPSKLELPIGIHNVSIRKEHCIPFDAKIKISKNEIFSLSALLTAQYKTCELYVDNDAAIYIDSTYVGTGKWIGDLPYGNHLIVCALEGYNSTSKEIAVSPESERIYMLPTPTPVLGSISIISSTENAAVKIDGEYVGMTPLHLVKSVPVGKRLIEVSKPNHLLFYQETIISEDSTIELYAELTEFTEVHIHSNPSGAQISINGEIYGTTPCSTDLLLGEHLIELHKQGFRPARKTITVQTEQPDVELRLVRQYINPSSFYISSEYRYLNNSWIKLGIGGYIKGINIEANAMFSLKESEIIYWNVPDKMTKPYGYTYKPIFWGGKIGYGFIIGNRTRITPQVGTGILNIEGSCVIEGNSLYEPSSHRGFSIPLALDTRIDFAVLPSVALSICPEYTINLIESELYKKLSDVSKTIDDYSNGLGLSLGINFYF